ncbi:MAG: rod shape-determining protein MreD [Acidimicrobiia bacterium]|nr:rod shape-determining protein MreD [Acidimicrobiia bacterium]
MMRVKAGLALFCLLAVQVSIFAHLRPFGVAPDVLLVAALVGGIIGGGDFGARHGFAAGLLLDLVIPGPFGLSAGVYGVMGYATGLFSRSFDSQDPRVVPILSGLTSFMATIVYGFGLGILGSEQFVEWRLIWVAFAVSVYSVVLVFPVQRLYQWVLATDGASPRSEPARGVVN